MPIPSKKKDPWMSLNRAAAALRLPRQTVLMRAIKGELVAKVVAERVVISRASVEQWLPPASEGEGVVESEDVDRVA